MYPVDPNEPNLTTEKDQESDPVAAETESALNNDDNAAKESQSDPPAEDSKPAESAGKSGYFFSNSCIHLLRLVKSLLPFDYYTGLLALM